ncbi:extracellular solute-binding protein [Paenibacillus terrigena]|uniref:ABC transporter substrate-binding protein n=1 Tax=Paenibacillus terrigena TaxID=369333 RepID=UPI0028D84EEA|nr:extracellular solute-binding protein [Paenibacillus terrigena]
MKKRSWLKLGSLLLAVAMFTGCGSTASNESAPQSDTPKTETQTESTKSDEQVTLKYYNWDNETMSATTSSLIQQFEAENPNIKVESVALVPGNSTETMKKLDIMISSGDQVDLMLFPSVEETMARASQGVLAPLDDFYAKDSLNPDDEYYVNPKFKGKSYAAMYQRSLWVVLLNKDMLDAAGLPVPTMGWTWDDYRDYAKKLTKGEGNDKVFGTYFHGWGDYADPILFNERKNPFQKEDLTPQFDDPSVKYFFEMRRAMEKDDKSVKPYADVIGAKLAYRTEFFNEKAAILTTGSWMVADTANTEQYPHKFKTAFAPVPRSSKDAEEGLTSIGGQYISVSENSKYKDAAYKFLRFVTTNTSDAKKELSGWKKADDKKIIEGTIAANPDLFDKGSLFNALFDPKIKSPGASEVAVAYGSQLKKVLEDGFSQFILDNTTAEDAMKTMMEQANKIIKDNTK